MTQGKRKLSWYGIGATLAGGAVAATLFDLSIWTDVRAALLPALSVISAAVLVRLARGLPFTNAEHFELDDFRSVASETKRIGRSLRALIYVCLFAMALILLATLPMEFKPWVPNAIKVVTPHVVSFALGAVVTYAFVRTTEIVQSDLALLKTQTRLLERAIGKKNRVAFDKELAKDSPPPIAGLEGFGKPLQ